MAEETCRCVVRAVPHGYLIEIASKFRPCHSALVFGDQEGMGLGVRVATALNLDRKLRGRILDSAGRRNVAEVWGKTADWCDSAGPLQGPNGVRWVGLAVLSGPENFRPSWCHARDYELLVLNPLGRKAFTQQEASPIVVKPGETLKLRFGVAVHETATEIEYDRAPIDREFSNMGKTSTSQDH